MKTADYRTKRGAERYAAEIRRKFPRVKAYLVPSQSFGYAIAVETPDRPGKPALVGKRPRNYGRNVP